MIAAWKAARDGAKTLLLEKTRRLGTKILISGGGKCNITHAGETEDVLRAFRVNEGRFLRPSMYRFLNRDILEMLHRRGLRTMTRNDGRVFPVDHTAKGVVAILEIYVRQAGVEVMIDAPVIRIEPGWSVTVGRPIPPNSGYRHAAEGPSRTFTARCVVVAVGGASYPNCGTTGDGWEWLRELGHTVVPTLPALAPIYLRDFDAWNERAGIALREVCLRARAGGREISRFSGDLLLTHQGISGPAALGVSREVAENPPAEVRLLADLTPNAADSDLDTEWKHLDSRRPASAALPDEIPDRFRPLIMAQAGIAPDCPWRAVDVRSRNRLRDSLRSLPLPPVRMVPLEKGEVTAGGVSLDEVDPKTMESRLHRRLYLPGEILDIAGPVGGYNLQAAWSTGYVAGESAAQT
jgi:hypothetical protein